MLSGWIGEEDYASLKRKAQDSNHSGETIDNEE